MTWLMYYRIVNHVLYCGNVSEKAVRKDLQKDINRVQEWCDTNRLTLNVSKTKIMSFMTDHKRKNKKK